MKFQGCGEQNRTAQSIYDKGKKCRKHNFSLFTHCSIERRCRCWFTTVPVILRRVSEVPDVNTYISGC
jgi:hypothetical protein